MESGRHTVDEVISMMILKVRDAQSEFRIGSCEEEN